MDRQLLNNIQYQEDTLYIRSFTYDLTIQEKLLIVSGALENIQPPQSDRWQSLTMKQFTI